MPALMPVDVVVIPASHTLSTLGDLFGPLGALAVGAVVVALGLLVLALSTGPARSANVEQPLGHGEIELSPASLQFRARWKGSMAPFDAPIETATLRVKGGKGEGDSGIIELRRGHWQARHGGRLLVYTDPSRSDGVRKVVVRAGKRGGQVTITGGRPGWL